MQLLNRVPKNKYLLTGLSLFLWLLLFDRYDFFTQFKAVQELNRLRKEKQFYLAEIEKNQRLLSQLQTNPDALERFARERFLMKKDDEVVFLMMEKDKP